ncbi:MAG TPA: hypothetical protein VGF52_03415 [Tepidisphaeraceae bacterium]|jgi:hypothetical protein
MNARLNVVIAFLACMLTSTLVHAQATTQPSNDATGSWKWSQSGPNGDVDFTLKLKQDGDKLTGTMSGFNGNDTDIQDGKVQDGQISFKVVRDFNGRQVVTTYTATMSGNELKGKTETIFSRDFEAKRD